MTAKKITKEALFKKTATAIRACEKLDNEKASALKTLANDYALVYDSIESMNVDKTFIINAIKNGFTADEQAILALSIDSTEFAKQEIKDKRKSIQSKASGYFPRLVKYTFPAEWEKTEKAKKANKAKANKSKPDESKDSEESSTGTLDLTSKANLAEFLNTVITTINGSEEVDYDKQAVVTSLQQIIKTLI